MTGFEKTDGISSNGRPKAKKKKKFRIQLHSEIPEFSSLGL
jgi:hypothetical protein